MEINVFMIDDDELGCQQAHELLDGKKIGNDSIKFSFSTDFKNGMTSLETREVDLLILDLFNGKPEEGNANRPGEEILNRVRKTCFTPVIFFTGLIKPVEKLASEIIRVVRKSEGITKLEEEMLSVIKTRLPLIKKVLNNYTKETLRAYFWDFVQPNWDKLSGMNDEVSLGYLLVRRLAGSLSKNKIIHLLEDAKISSEKIHPMEFYIYPPIDNGYQLGDIIKAGDKNYVVLTPSCDFAQGKAAMVLLGECVVLENTDEYKSYCQNPAKYLQKLKELIESRRGDRFFFLPKAPFLNNHTVDFQRLSTVAFEEFKRMQRLATLDDPFAQSMLAYFIRYYNRIGFEDIDSEHIVSLLPKPAAPQGN